MSAIASESTWVALGSIVVVAQIIITLFMQITGKVITDWLDKKKGKTKNYPTMSDVSDIKANLLNIIKFTEDISKTTKTLDTRLDFHDKNFLDMITRITKLENNIYCQGKNNKIINSPSYKKNNDDVDCLIVDNDIFIARLIQDKIEKAGFNAIICNNDDEALLFIKKYNFNIAFINYNLNENKSSIHIWEKCQNEHNNITICFYSDQLEDVSDIIEKSPYDLEFLKKPFNLDDLKHKINKSYQCPPS